MFAIGGLGIALTFGIAMRIAGRKAHEHSTAREKNTAAAPQLSRTRTGAPRA
jgi:hypothetical protein